MMLRRQRRRGTVLVEAALIYPVLFMLVLGIILLGIGVFRYQQVSHIAREASRWASVHGARWAQENGKTAATPEDVYNNAIVPQAAGMGLENLNYSVSWSTSNQQTHAVTVTANGQSSVQTVTNFVSVTVTCTWNTGLFGSIPVSSTSVTPMNY
jgi:Flp pilus assembly protein TadG